MLRKFVLIIAIVLMPLNFSVSQSNNSVSAGIGFVTAPDFINIIENIALMTISFGSLNQSTNFTGITPAYYLNYSRNFTKSLTLGVSFIYQKFEKEIYLQPSFNPSINEKVGLYTSSYFSFYPEFSVYYLTTENFTLFSTFGFGICFKNDQNEWTGSQYGTPSTTSESSTIMIPSFQLNPIGFQIGSSLRITSAIGIGYQGVFALSLRYCFSD